MDTVVLVLPLPAKGLYPNARHSHWSSRSRAVKKARQDAWIVALDAINRLGLSVPWPAASVVVHYFNSGKWHDAGEIAAACKAYFDGLQDAQLILNDSTLEQDGVKRFKCGKSECRIELHLTRLDAKR